MALWRERRMVGVVHDAWYADVSGRWRVTIRQGRRRILVWCVYEVDADELVRAALS